MRDKRILLIDGYNVMLACNAIYKITNSNSEPISMYLYSLNTIRSFIDKFKPTKVFFVLDGPNAGERRRKLYPNYKGKRRVKAREGTVRISDSDNEAGEVFEVEGSFQNQLRSIYEFLKLLPVTVVMVPYCEADDVIAYLALKNKENFDSIIVSNDRDYLQLIQPNIFVYRWKAKKLYNSQEIINEFNISPDNFIYRKIILGDVSDLIEGLNGIGEKTFQNLSSIFLENKFENIGQLVEFFENLTNMNDYKKREQTAIKKIIENKDKMLLLYQIMKLEEDCLKLNHREILEKQVEEQKEKVFSRLSAKIKLQKDQFNRLYLGFNDEKWLQPFAFLKSHIEVIV